jgi:hypothetical protein
MSDVHQGPRRGQATDPFEARANLGRFLEAARVLNGAWDSDLDVPTYPRYLPAFEVFLADLETWREEVEDEPYRAPREFAPLDLTDRAAVRVWLADLRKQIEDATGAGEDATRPFEERDLGPRAARVVLGEARAALQQLLRAAERGLD